MKIEILITGDEIIKGDVADTASQYIAKKLLDAGIFISRFNIAGDDETEIAGIISEIASRADIAVVTGGLGPTSDDVTASAAASAAGVKTGECREAVEMIIKRLKSIGAEINTSNRKQAFMPETAVCIVNKAGIAPGFSMQIQQCRFFFLPGVPSEMRAMFDSDILPAISEITGSKGIFLENRIALHGVPEARANELLHNFKRIFPEINLGFRATSPGVLIKISMKEKSRHDRQTMKNALKWVTDKFGSSVVSTEGESLEETVGKILIRNGKTVAIAESCTGGLIGHMLTSFPGSSRCFLLSAVTYSNSAKISVLGVNPETLDLYGAVHENTAIEMAEGARKISGADYGLSITGIAGPGGGTPDKPVGTVCIGLSGNSGTKAVKFLVPGFDRTMTKRRFAYQALDILRREILKNC